MSDRDVRRVARMLAELKNSANGSRARQLPSSSVTLEDGTEKALLDGVTAGVDALIVSESQADDISSLGDVSTGGVLDQAALPGRLDDVGGGVDVAFEAAQQAARDIEAARVELDEKLTVAREQISAAETLIADAKARADEAFGVAGTAGTVAADAKAAASSAVSAASTAQATASSASSSSAAAATAAANAQTAADAAGAAAAQAAKDAADKSAAAQAAAKTYSDAQDAATKSAALAAASTDAQVKATAAKDAATAAAALDAKTKADAAQTAATAVANAAQTTANQAKDAAAAAQSAAGSAQTIANNALTIAGTKGKVFYSTAAPSGTGTAAGDLWRQTDASKNVIAEWYWTGTAWQPSQITTAAIANLDVGKLTVGAGVISDLVAQNIAARSGAFMQLGVDQLTVTGSTAIKQAVIDKLWADVVKAKMLTVTEKIIANDIFAAGVVSASALAATAIDGKVITGAIVRTAASGQRLQLDASGLRAFNTSGVVTAALNADSGGLRLTGSIRTDADTDGSYASLAPDGLYVRDNSGSGRTLYLARFGLFAYSQSFFIRGDGYVNLAAYPETGTETYLRIRSAGEIISNRSLPVLWEGVWYANATTAYFYTLASEQLNGIILEWSEYIPGSGTATDSSFQHTHIPKQSISKYPNAGYVLDLMSWKTSVRKYVYVSDNRIVGHAENSVAPNNTLVLRRVYGY